MLQLLNCHLLTLTNNVLYCYFFQFDPTKMDRVELAFRKFDLNQDGYLSREEFDQVRYHMIYFRTTYLVDVLCRQPIKLFQVVSTSEFHEY